MLQPATLGPVKKATTPALSDCSFDGEKPQPRKSHLNMTEGPHSPLPKSFSPLCQGWVFWTRLNLQPGYRFRIRVRTGRETKQELLTRSFEGAAGGRGRLQKSLHNDWWRVQAQDTACSAGMTPNEYLKHCSTKSPLLSLSFLP